MPIYSSKGEAGVNRFRGVANPDKGTADSYPFQSPLPSFSVSQKIVF